MTTLTITRADTGEAIGTVPFGMGHPVCSNTLAWAFMGKHPAPAPRDRRAKRRRLAATRRTMRRASRPLVLTLADGTARKCEPLLIGQPAQPGYRCAYCDYPFAGTSCPNPACDTMLSAERLAAWRAERAAYEAGLDAEIARSASVARAEAESRARRTEAYSVAYRQAEAAGQCLACLSRSMRGGGTRPKFIKHRDVGNCPVVRDAVAE